MVEMAGVYVLAASLAAAVLLGVLWRRGYGRVRARRDCGVRLSAAEVGAPLGRRATLLQFSSAFCQPCRATRRILADVASSVDGVAHIDVDAESNLALVRRMDVMRTPTVLVLDANGRVVKQASGQPRKADVIAALGDAVRGES